MKIFSQLLIIRSYTSCGSLKMYTYASHRSLKMYAYAIRGFLKMYAYASRGSLKMYAYASRRSLKMRVRTRKAVAEPPNPRGVNPIPLARLRVYCTLVAAVNPGPADRRTPNRPPNSWEGSGENFGI